MAQAKPPPRKELEALSPNPRFSVLASVDGSISFATNVVCVTVPIPMGLLIGFGYIK